MPEIAGSNPATQTIFKVNEMSDPKTPYELFGNECGPGWQPLIKPLLEAAKAHNVQVLQIKEKFGGLRVYLGNAPDWLHDMCDLMERLSFHICERCGKPGEVRGGGWILTLCDDCHKEEK